MPETVTATITSQPEKINLGQKIRNRLEELNFSKMAAYSAFFGIGVGATYVGLVSTWYIAASVMSVGGIVALLLTTYFIIQVASYSLGSGVSGLLSHAT